MRRGYRRIVAWIDVITEDDGEGARLDAIKAIHSLSPDARAAHDALYDSAMR
jgi:hypothetical protein